MIVEIEVPDDSIEDFLIYDVRKQKLTEQVAIVYREIEDRGMWRQVTMRHLAVFLNITGNMKTRMVAHLLRVTDGQNRIIGKVEEHAKSAGVSIGTAESVFKILQKNGFLKKKYDAHYMIDPRLLLFGDKKNINITIARWKDMPSGETTQKELR